MILYKYFPPARLNDILRNRRIRFTQPGDLNDPFEFRPKIREVASDVAVQSHVEEHFDDIVEEELAKYGALTQFLPQTNLRGLLQEQKAMLPALFRLLEPAVIEKLSPMIDGILNSNVGILCLSEVRDSLLMWGHYANNHEGFVVGFDSEHPFFSRRRTDKDEFGFLRPVQYALRRPQVTLGDTESADWFSTKSEQWSYEKEWRIVRVLSEAEKRIERSPFPICLFEFPPDAVRQIIAGVRSPLNVVSDIRALARGFPTAELLRACEDSDYGLVISQIA
jgi:Protein of unknown function (DUF2971)